MIMAMKARAYFLFWPILFVTLAPRSGQPVEAHSGHAGNPTVALSASRKYISPDRSFEFNVPAGYELYTDRNKPGDSYIPVCHEHSIVCAMFPPDQYQGTTFGAASFEVTLLDAKTANACTTPGRLPISGAAGAPSTPEFKIDTRQPSRVIGGVRFIHAFDAAGASSSDIEINRYRGFKDGRCYSLAIHVTYGNFGSYDPRVIKEFTKQDVEHVTEDLMRVLDSFKILG
jgi:hypothetical protein